MSLAINRRDRGARARWAAARSMRSSSSPGTRSSGPAASFPDLTANAAYHCALPARRDGSGAWTGSLDTVREDVGDGTVSSACVEHSGYAGSTAVHDLATAAR